MPGPERVSVENIRQTRYLISRIEACQEITLKPWTEVEELDGEAHLERIRWRDVRAGSTELHEIRHLFVMTGANPNTAWLAGCLALDNKQFIETGAEVEFDWPLRRAPYLLETSRLRPRRRFDGCAVRP